MTLYLIGLGLGDLDSISLKGLNIAKRCQELFLENYTSILRIKKEKLEEITGKHIKIIDRDFIERRFNVEEAKYKDVAILIIGDVFSATTHFTLFLEAKKAGIDVEVVNNSSIITSIGIVGLSLYKYGKIVSIPFPDKSFTPKDYYHNIAKNKECGMHTLCLLDVKTEKNLFMKINEAIEILLMLEEEFKKGVLKKDTLCIGVARLGEKDHKIRAGTASELLKKDFGDPPHSLIIPADKKYWDSIEEEAINLWSK